MPSYEQSAGRVVHELTVADIDVRTDMTAFSFEDTSELNPETPMIGQGRAESAMDFGLQLHYPDYNLFVAGPTGTGKTTYSMDKVRQTAANQPPADDWCYVHHFALPDEPRALRFAPGQGRLFARTIAELMTESTSELMKSFDSDAYNRECSELEKSFNERAQTLWSELESVARQWGFALHRTAAGVATVLQKPDGTAITQPEFEALPTPEQQKIRQHQQEVTEKLEDTLRHVNGLQSGMRKAQATLDERTARYAVEHLFTDLLREYTDTRQQTWLHALCDDIVLHHREIRQAADSHDGNTAGTGDLLRRYQVNVFVDQTSATFAPVVMETNPTYFNLFGRVEYKGVSGGMVADFTMIKAGALHRANSGYLLLQARDLLTRPAVWDGLKRALRSGVIKIENPVEDQLWLSTSAIRPEVIPLHVKVVLLGTTDLYQLLYDHDEEFRKYFKVKVEFDSQMERSPDANRQYAHFIAAHAQAHHLPPFSRSAVARVLDFSARQSGTHDKLSTQFSPIVELLTESGYFASRRGLPRVEAEDVDRALADKDRRSGLIREKVLQQILDGTILVDVEGARVGQVNGLAVLSTGDYAFGEPHRITARTYAGRRGVVNVERETSLSGHLHDKGLLILGAYLAGEFAQEQPLSVTATIVFEQTYSTIDGDSASSTELYAILSSLSRLPIHQGIAVTGSVNQFGEIQPIGGVNEKIEGFYYICKAKGLTGTQGVVIPHQNVRNLFLSSDLLKAIDRGQFHIWPVAHIASGIEILTGVPAGSRPYGAQTVFGKVEQRLQNLARGASAQADDHT